jgi:hypothetical protein
MKGEYMKNLVRPQFSSFGDEHVMGPSEWLNVDRTFDTIRVDLHHPVQFYGIPPGLVGVPQVNFTAPLKRSKGSTRR